MFAAAGRVCLHVARFLERRFVVCATASAPVYVCLRVDVRLQRLKNSIEFVCKFFEKRKKNTHTQAHEREKRRKRSSQERSVQLCWVFMLTLILVHFRSQSLLELMIKEERVNMYTHIYCMEKRQNQKMTETSSDKPLAYANILHHSRRIRSTIQI